MTMYYIVKVKTGHYFRSWHVDSPFSFEPVMFPTWGEHSGMFFTRFEDAAITRDKIESVEQLDTDEVKILYFESK